jgi:hypothetical protein
MDQLRRKSVHANTAFNLLFSAIYRRYLSGYDALSETDKLHRRATLRAHLKLTRARYKKANDTNGVQWIDDLTVHVNAWLLLRPLALGISKESFIWQSKLRPMCVRFIQTLSLNPHTSIQEALALGERALVAVLGDKGKPTLRRIFNVWFRQVIADLLPHRTEVKQLLRARMEASDVEALNARIETQVLNLFPEPALTRLWQKAIRPACAAVWHSVHSNPDAVFESLVSLCIGLQDVGDTRHAFFAKLRPRVRAWTHAVLMDHMLAIGNLDGSPETLLQAAEAKANERMSHAAALLTSSLGAQPII